MHLRPAGTRTRRTLVVLGVLLVAAGCSEPPTREQADADVLVELDGASRATVTLEANSIGFLSPIVHPRGGPPTTSSTEPVDPAPPTPEQIAQVQNAFLHRRRSDITTEIRHTRAALTGIGDALAPGTVVTAVHRTPNRIVGTLRFADPLRAPVRVRPAAMARALDRGGLSHHDTVWVGICIPSTRGSWSRTPDAFDRALGCAGWVPDRRAGTVGVLIPGSRPSSTFWPLVGLAAVAIGLVALAVTRSRTGRRPWYAPVAFVLALVALVASITLVRVADAAGDLDEAFDTRIDRGIVDQAHAFTGPGVILVIIGLGEAAWFASDRDRYRHHLRRQSAFDDQPPNRSLRGSSV